MSDVWLKTFRQYECSLWTEFSKKTKEDKPGIRAMEYSEESGNLPVFAHHVGKNTYNFVVSSWHYFYEIFHKLPKEKRNFNEIIREGFPFNFYGDAELYRETNPEFSPGSEKEKEIIELAKKSMIDALCVRFNTIDRNSLKIIDVDSSDEKKLSRHIIIRIPGFALRDWQTALVLFRDIFDPLPDNSILWVNHETKKGIRKPFLDMAVYTRDRQFRCYGSSKFGSDRYFHFPGYDNPGDTPNKEKFFDSLVSYFKYEELENLSILAIEGTAKKTRIIKTEPGYVRTTTTNKSRKRKANDENHWLVKILSGIFNEEVYKHVFEEGSSKMAFYLKSNDCKISGGHKSNHIVFVLDLESKTMIQRCTDEDCKGKIGITEEIPKSYWDDIERYEKERNEFETDIFD